MTHDPADRLSSFWRFLADAEFRDYCPIYASIGHAIAGDVDIIARLVGITDERKVEPVLCLAAMKYLADDEPDGALARIYDGRSDADPWPAFRAQIVERFEDLASVMRTRTIQTNEVGRAAFTAPMLDLIHRRANGSPLHLIEIGPSAGLNLSLDKFHIDYGPAGSCGPDDSPVHLSCDVLNDLGPRIPDAVPTIASRVGLDLSPLDVTDPDHVRWLEACIWPGLDERLARFRAAVELARADPPDLRAGNAVELLPTALDEVPPGETAVVLSTWVMAYLGAEERAAIGEALAAHARAKPDRTVAAVTGEYPSIAPWIPAPERPAAIDEPKGASLLGVGIWAGQTTWTEPIAWVQAHGRWIDWLEVPRSP